MKNEAVRHYLTVYAVTFIFLVFGVWEIVNPQYWSVFVPSFISGLFNSINFLVQIHGFVLVVLAISLIFGFKRKLTAILGTLIMADIVFSLFIGSGFSDLLIRDIVITLFVASLYFDNYKK